VKKDSLSQTSSRSDLKRLSLGFFEERRPNKEKKNKEEDEQRINDTGSVPDPTSTKVPWIE